MRISNGHVVVLVLAVLALAGLAASHFKLHHVVLPPSSRAVAQQLAEDKMNTFSAAVADHLAQGRKPNRLIHEKSPYLLQHAFNPVDWYPWGEEAFAKARRENKPIFLSIGYSTCHWCHVMERESFENDSIAAIMNEHYVCIKVDREERPDVDRVYMAVLQGLTGAGGWPLSAWLTPDLKPFYAGTYFPPESRYGRPGFPQLLLQLSRAWQEQREKVLESSTQIMQAMQAQAAAPGAAGPVAWTSLARAAFAQFERSYDERLGGFGSAPKFPRPAVFNFLLRYHGRTQEKSALDMTLHTLRCMWAGGMYDHLGGGFHRYAVDAHWRVPHFEKMLYDQAQLACAYLEAYQLTRAPFYAQVAREVLDYVLRDMTHPDGGFYSAEDADSAPDPAHPAEKEEGAFYLWRKQEIVALLGERDAEIFNFLHGVRDSGNTLSDPHGEFGDRNVLYAARTPAEAAIHFARPEAEINTISERCRAQLFEARLQRPRPHRDDKIITAWNGLMISAFARAYQVLEERMYLEAAGRAAAFVLARNYDPAGATLKRRYRDGESKHPAQLEDYAFFVQGLLDLYEAGFEIAWLQFAEKLTETQIRLFRDADGGGFYDTPGGDQSILLRMKEEYDGAEPSGNAVAAANLLRLAHMLDQPHLWELAEHGLRLFAARLEQMPHAAPQMLTTMDFSQNKPLQIIIAGEPQAEDTRTLLRCVHERFLPNKILLLAGGEGREFLNKRMPMLSGMTMLAGRATAYVCENYACQLPTAEVAVLTQLLSKSERPAAQ